MSVIAAVHMRLSLFFFFFNDTATTEIYTLSLHDALPIYDPQPGARDRSGTRAARPRRYSHPQRKRTRLPGTEDRKSTRLNSSHSQISYAVFCLKKKNKKWTPHRTPKTTYAHTSRATITHD